MKAPIFIPHDFSSNLVRTIESLFASVPERDGDVIHVVNTSKGYEFYFDRELSIIDLTCRSGPFRSHSGYELPENLTDITGFSATSFAVERRMEEGEGAIYILTRKGKKKDALRRSWEYQALLEELA